MIYLTGAATVSGLFSHQHLLFDLASHFKVQYLAITIVCLPVLLLLKASHLHSIVCLAVIVLNAAHIIPWFVPTEVNAKTSANEIKIFVHNVLSSNTSTTPVLQQIEGENPDLIVLLESNVHWLQGLSSIQTAYPYKVLVPEEGFRGIALYSKLPISKHSIEYFGTSPIPSIQAQISTDNSTFNLIATHPFPPISSHHYSSRNNQLSAIAKRATMLSNAPLIVAGDLNTTMWSTHYQVLETAGKLQNASKGFGIGPTWPSHLSIMGIPIDHILVSKHFYVRDFKVGTGTGSDHRPVIAIVQLSN